MSKIIFCLHIVLIFFFVFGCSSLRGQMLETVFVPAESWKSSVTSSGKRVGFLEYDIIDSDSILLNELDSNDFVVLNEYEEGYEIAVRALYTYLGGVYRVYENDDNTITVSYGVLGKKGEPYHKSALRIFVKRLPKKVYVFCTTVS